MLPTEVIEETTAPPPDEHTNGLTDSSDVLALMRDGLKETTPTEVAEPAETAAAEEPDGAEAEKTEPGEAPKTQPGSRRAKTVERALTAAEQKIADAEARASAAEAKAKELEARVVDPTAEQTRVTTEKLQAEYGDWIGTPEGYAEAERLSLMDPDAEGWDFDKHKTAVNNLTTWKERRKWAGVLAPNAERVGEAKAFATIEKDFVETLSADLPEDKRAAYIKHPGGIPGAVRFYAEAVYAPKIEALEDAIAEKDAEIARLQTTGGGQRSPAPGGSNGASSHRVDMSKWSPEMMMQHELREQAKASRGRR